LIILLSTNNILLLASNAILMI